jgi:hypothetical protein
MINTSNYFDYFKNNNVLSRFPQAAPLHDFIVMVTNGGRDWSSYHEEPEVKETIDAYFAKLEGKSVNPPQRNSTATTVRYNRQTHHDDGDDSGEDHTSRRNKRGPGKRKTKTPAPTRKKKHRKAATGTKKRAKKHRKVLNLPKGKLVELVDPHLLFVGRYLRMNNQKRTRNALEKFFSQINQAADARVLRKASPYAHHILYIQKQLLRHLSGTQEEVSVEIPAAKFDELLRAVAKEQQMASVRLLKRYHNMAGRPTSIDKATKLYNEMYNAIEKGKIPEKDRLFKRVAKVMRDLSDYVKAEDTNAELVRLPAELGSVLGFMDGCLCTKDREMKPSDVPQDVSCSFRGK